MMNSTQIRTSSQVRKDFLDFFKSKQHTIVPSSSLMPDSPNLLFTNAGMNQFVPIFLGQTKCPYSPGRAADTQKCIRAGGKHNDLDDVGLDTYHHTFFEMLGNWSFGDYFKKEAIDWAWELVVGIWKFPPQRLYATVYNPDKSKNDPSEFDQEAWNFWAEKFRSVGLDPAVHIVNGNKKDNFWMMGETGPCGPCSELHVDLTPDGDTRGSLVNKGDARCIEIWNLVFIQFNANPDGTFSPLPAKHVDTGMGFERATSIIQGTKNFSDFANAKISNYETDIFRPIFDAIEKLSGKKYGSTLPKPGSTGDTEQEKADVAFRVIADHIRTLSFAIADGIQPGNNDRNYVLRRILRRAVRYGRTLGFHEPFFYKLVDVVAENFGDVFPEIRAKKKIVQEAIQREEEAFNKTLDEGIKIFTSFIESKFATLTAAESLEGFMVKFREKFGCVPTEKKAFRELVAKLKQEQNAHAFIEKLQPVAPAIKDAAEQQRWGAQNLKSLTSGNIPFLVWFLNLIEALEAIQKNDLNDESLANRLSLVLPQIESIKDATDNLRNERLNFSGAVAFMLYDTYGFPLDLTELMARERGLKVDNEGFEKLMEEQRKRSQDAQKKTIVSAVDIPVDLNTIFTGYEQDEESIKVEVERVAVRNMRDVYVIPQQSPFYSAMGGQVGDAGKISILGKEYEVIDVVKLPHGQALKINCLPTEPPNWFQHLKKTGNLEARIKIDEVRRRSTERHHTVTHLLHWALHEVASKEASQKGSFVGPDKLTFDFNSAPLTPQQVADIEKLVNERILENAGVSWTEVPHADVKNRKDVMQFFGDKYGDPVRVVQIGGGAGKLDGYSMELCGGTHTRATGEIGLFRIVSEAAVAAGVRRIEAVAGLTAYCLANEQLQLIRSIAGKINSPVHELEKKVEVLLAHQKELEKSLKSAQQREAAGSAKDLLAKAETINGVPAIIVNLGANDGDTLQAIADSLKSQFKGVVVLGGAANGAVTLIATVSADFTAKVQAGKIIQAIAPIVGGKGGGKPDNARGGGKDAAKLDEALAKAKSLLG
jgi:alanyl-tRNA synthetase